MRSGDPVAAGPMSPPRGIGTLTTFRTLAIAATLLTVVPRLAGPAHASPGDDVPPTETAALLAWLRAGTYSQWPKESAPHRSMGSHRTLVVTYLSPALDGSLRAGSASHPAGAAAVKELLDEQGRRTGWAVSVKTAADSGQGSGWYWFEIVDAATGGPVAQAHGVPACVGCHLRGSDFVLIPHPLD